MRRVDIEVTLFYATDIEIEEQFAKNVRISGDSRKWGLRVSGQAGVSAGGKAFVGLIALENKNMKKTADYFIEGGGFDVGVGVDIAKASLSGSTSI